MLDIRGAIVDIRNSLHSLVRFETLLFLFTRTHDFEFDTNCINLGAHTVQFTAHHALQFYRITGKHMAHANLFVKLQSIEKTKKEPPI